ncbi:hypothetical protein [Vibrio sp. 10N.261.52.A1]|uniref:hypothetical protein n=1 Tax=Vibrio sp. 10N.261.52.A1 TaxID=1880849 RepID=UPI000C865438|nr:hypothetical protein [Vibrio sp. 10N.261.52.A1]PML53366.1 hypothetical protein BCT81_10215 [Vibrio sp. 10N.261.52.A1]
MSTISRQQILSDYERVWEQTIVEEAYQQAIVELLEQGHVMLRVEDYIGFSLGCFLLRSVYQKCSTSLVDHSQAISVPESGR